MSAISAFRQLHESGCFVIPNPWDIGTARYLGHLGFPALATGVAGLSIEDATGDRDSPLYDLPFAVERIRAARAAIDETGTGVLLTARAECHLVGHPEPLRESIKRLVAYAEAGADVLYAPGPRSREDIRAIVSAVAPKPVNVLVSSAIGLTVSELAELGVRRISVGSALARAAWGAFVRAAESIAKDGSFDGFADAEPFADLNDFFRRDLKERATKS
jgi:2-methylisocitrate lyase-like PEP mutase family enzyme